MQFAATCAELTAAGFFPVVMLCSKDLDPHDAAGVLAGLSSVTPLLVEVAAGICIGWELSIWLSPTDVQTLIDAISPQFTPSQTPVYVHFAAGVASWQPDGHPTSYFWQANVGKLTGILHQRIQGTTPEQYQTGASGCLADVLTRFAGNDGFPVDSGFGHPFDCVALEITAMPQFDGNMSEAQGDQWGTVALTTPAQGGPAGSVGVMGSGNGQT